MRAAAERASGGIGPAWFVVWAGVVAALHVGKLAPALPVLRDLLDISLVQAGFLLSLGQLAGMTLGLLVGLSVDGLGLKRGMMTGLLLLSLASLAGGMAHSATALLAWRALEGLGFLLVVMPAPNLIRHLVNADRLSTMLGIWGTYMPLGMALALLAGPWVIAQTGWQSWWWGLGAITLLTAAGVGWQVPPDSVRAHQRAVTSQRLPDEFWRRRLQQTLTARGPWLVALSFAMYSGQWLAVIGFLPTIYAQAGLTGGATASLTTLVAAVNMIGNMASGWLLARGVRPQTLLYAGFGVMGLGAWAAFMSLSWMGSDVGLPPQVRFVAVLLFSMVGGVIPGTLFYLAVRLAPSDRTVSTTVGWMQQCSSLGQFVGPPLVAWVAGVVGGWHWSWSVTGVCSVMGLVLASRVRDTDLK